MVTKSLGQSAGKIKYQIYCKTLHCPCPSGWHHATVPAHIHTWESGWDLSDSEPWHAKLGLKAWRNLKDLDAQTNRPVLEPDPSAAFCINCVGLYHMPKCLSSFLSSMFFFSSKTMCCPPNNGVTNKDLPLHTQNSFLPSFFLPAAWKVLRLKFLCQISKDAFS